MSIQVKSFDVYKAEEELSKCPKIVKDYVKVLKEHSERHFKNVLSLKKEILNLKSQENNTGN